MAVFMGCACESGSGGRPVMGDPTIPLYDEQGGIMPDGTRCDGRIDMTSPTSQSWPGHPPEGAQMIQRDASSRPEYYYCVPQATVDAEKAAAARKLAASKASPLPGHAPTDPQTDVDAAYADHIAPRLAIGSLVLGIGAAVSSHAGYKMSSHILTALAILAGAGSVLVYANRPA